MATEQDIADNLEKAREDALVTNETNIVDGGTINIETTAMTGIKCKELLEHCNSTKHKELADIMIKAVTGYKNSQEVIINKRDYLKLKES